MHQQARFTGMVKEGFTDLTPPWAFMRGKMEAITHCFHRATDADPQTITAIAGGTATILGAITVLLAELRRWRKGRDGNPPNPPGNP